MVGSPSGEQDNYMLGIFDLIESFLALLTFVLILVKVVNTIGIEKRRAAFDAVDDVSLIEQQFGEV